PSTTIDLLEVTTRAEDACHIIAGFSLATPALADQWRQIASALADIPTLSVEIGRVHSQLTACRLDRANLAAAGLVTLKAHRNGESDPLSYLRDELRAQGFTTERGRL
ncbi:MAG: hypothetical protein ACRDNS_26910, partial [Trebonia sp.]